MIYMEDIRHKVKKGDLKKIAVDLGDFLEKKNEDYKGASFRLGINGVFVHLVDKIDRLENLMKGHKNNFEGIKDTVSDIAGYAIIGIKILEEQENADKSRKH